MLTHDWSDLMQSPNQLIEDGMINGQASLLLTSMHMKVDVEALLRLAGWLMSSCSLGTNPG